MSVDRVIANPPFSLKMWGKEEAENDAYGRFTDADLRGMCVYGLTASTATELPVADVPSATYLQATIEAANGTPELSGEITAQERLLAGMFRCDRHQSTDFISAFQPTSVGFFSYSTVTLLAKFLGLSTSVPRAHAV